MCFPQISQGWTKKEGRIYCPAPLPVELSGPLLTNMLVPAPYKAPKKKAGNEAKKTRGGLRRRGASDTRSEDSDAHSSSEEDEEEEGDESPAGGRKKRTASTSLEAQSPKRGKLPFQRSPLPLPIAARSGIPGPSPW